MDVLFIVESHITDVGSLGHRAHMSLSLWLGPNLQKAPKKSYSYLNHLNLINYLVYYMTIQSIKLNSYIIYT